MIRRYSKPKPSRGTVIPSRVREEVRIADGGRCVGPRVGMPGDCSAGTQWDHVRASGGMGMKSPTEKSNGVLLCNSHHMLKTQHGREWRPALIAYIEQRDAA